MKNLIIVFCFVLFTVFPLIMKGQFSSPKIELDSISNDTAYVHLTNFVTSNGNHWIDTVDYTYHIQNNAHLLEHYSINSNEEYTKIPIKYCSTRIGITANISYDSLYQLFVGSNILHVESDLVYTLHVQDLGNKQFKINMTGNWDYAEIRCTNTMNNTPFILIAGWNQSNVLKVKDNSPNPVLDKSKETYFLFCPYMSYKLPRVLTVTFYKNNCKTSVGKYYHWG